MTTISSDIIKQKYYMMCTKCFNVEKVKYTLHRYEEIQFYNKSKEIYRIPKQGFSMYCETCKEIHETILIDYLLGYAISNLNKKGYYTEYCCSGHSIYDIAYISFNDNIEISSLPEYWNFANEIMIVDNETIKDVPNIIKKPYTIRCYFSKYIKFKKNQYSINDVYHKRLSIHSLNEWIDSLPTHNILS